MMELMILAASLYAGYLLHRKPGEKLFYENTFPVTRKKGNNTLTPQVGRQSDR